MNEEKLSPQTPEEFDAELNAVLQQSTSTKKKKGFFKRLFKKKLTYIVLAVVVVLFVLPVFFAEGEEAAPVVTQNLAQKDILQTLTLSGPLAGTDSVEVVSNLHSEVKDILVKPGDQVKKGQLIAVLDQSDLQSALEQAENSYNTAKINYQDSIKANQNAYEKATQDLQSAQAAYERKKALYDEGGIALIDLEAAEDGLADAKRNVSAYEVANGKVKPNAAALQQMDTAQFNLEQKQKDYQDLQVLSPINGTVTRVNAKVGRFADDVEDKKPMFVIENLVALEMEIKVSEYTIGKVQLGQQVNISADILNGQVVAGEVSAISPTGEIKGNGSTERIIPITIKVAEVDSPLIAGITAKAEVILAEAKNALVAPLSALIQNADGTVSLATVENKVVKMVPITVGIESDLEAEIFPVGEAVLSSATVIIPNPAADLQDGAVVAVTPVADGSEVE